MPIQNWQVADAGFLAPATYQHFGQTAQGNLAGTSMVALGASNLGLPLGDFKDGFYSVGSAQALVAFDKQHNSIVLSFRGSDDLGDLVADVTGRLGTAATYLQYLPLIQQVDALAAANPHTQVLVTGYSLGGAMAEMYMSQHHGTQFTGVTFGSIGSGTVDNAPGSDPRVLNIGHSDDGFVNWSSNHDQGADVTVDLPNVGTNKLTATFQEHGAEQYHSTASDLSASTLFTNFAANPGSFHVVIDESVSGSSNNLSHTLTGTGGMDFILGLAGDDTIVGGKGADLLDGGGGINTLSYAGSSAGVVINLATGAASGGDAQGDRFSNFMNLIGSGKADTLIGDSHNNVINGGGGADVMAGNGGFDTFVLKAHEANGDRITDFAGNGAANGDTLQLVGFGTAAQGATFTHVAGTNNWQIHSGLDGHNEIITLSNGASVHASDFSFQMFH